jgi:23S rRNA pseudouridine2604 synthase
MKKFIKKKLQTIQIKLFNTKLKEEEEKKIRISKILSNKGICSRREADKYILEGNVLLDGEVVKELGTKGYMNQKVELRMEGKEKQESLLTIIINKPIGYLCHSDDQNKYRVVNELLKKSNISKGDEYTRSLNISYPIKGLAPAGRLDYESTGLLVLTQNGTIAKEIISEKSNIEKEYIVKINVNEIKEKDLKLLNHGMSLYGKKLEKANVFWFNKKENLLKFILKEGKKRQIRKMLELIGIKVISLNRIRIGKIELGNLKIGCWRVLNSKFENF